MSGESELASARILPGLETAWLGRAWRALGACESTNDEAAAWARAGAPHGAVVVADAQTRGRGRRGHAWHSPPGDNLYLSVVLRPALEPARVPPVTLAAGVAVVEAAATVDVQASLKWPNDVLANGRKLAGILTEMASAGGRVEHVIVGIGVNLNTTAFPPELSSIATSLAGERGGRSLDRAGFARALAARLEHGLDLFFERGAAPIADAWRRHAAFLGKDVRVTTAGEPLFGRAEDIDAEGALLLRLPDRRLVRVFAGELVPAAG